MARPKDCPVDPDFNCPADCMTPPNPHVISDGPRMSTQDMETIEGHLGLVLSRIDAIGATALTKDDITQAMRAGFVAALHDEDTWAAAARGIRRRAHREAGNLMVDALTGALKKLLLFAVAGLLVYSIGGWSALAGAWKAIWGGGAP